ncbi:hypothetical protein BDR22DRAFT_333420 [Usnea florida]
MKNIWPPITFFSKQDHSEVMKEQSPRTPASSRSIVRNHSPYSESTGPIVRQGFVAARVRALQGLSHPTQIGTRSHSPLTPCPPRRLHVYKLRSPPRSSLAPKSLLTRAEMPRIGSVKHIRGEILSKDNRSLVGASGGSARSLSHAPSFPPQEHQSSLELATPGLLVNSRRAGNPSLKLFKDTVPSGFAQRNREHIKVPSAPSGILSEDDQLGSVPMKVSSLSGEAILSPRAMQIDLVEPHATWTPFPQGDDYGNSYFRQQVLKPRASIADKLVSMVEQGWAEGYSFPKGYNDNEFVTHALQSESYPHDSRLDRADDSLSQKLCLRKVLSHGESYSLQTAPRRGEFQHATGRRAPPPNEPKTFVSCRSQKRMQLQAKRSPAVHTNQRSSSDFGIYHLKSGSVAPTRERRAWTSPVPDHLTSKQRHIQREVSPTLWSTHIRDHRSRAQDLESTGSPLSGEGSLSRPGFDLPMLGDEQLRQDSTAVSKFMVSRRSSSNTKGSTRSASRTTSFFKRFPWYTIALVDKQPVVQDSSKVSFNNYKASRSTSVTQHDPTSGQIKPLTGASKSHTLVESGYAKNDKTTKTGTPKNQGSIGQQAPNDLTSYHESSSQYSIQQTTSPQETNAWRVVEQTNRTPERQQKSHANRGSSAKDRPSSRVPTLTRFPSHSGLSVVSLESPVSGHSSQSFQSLWPEVKEDPRMLSYDSLYADPTKLQADGKHKHGSRDSGTVKLNSEFTTSRNSSNDLGLKMDESTSKRSAAWTASLPANGHRSDQDRSVRRELKGKGNGIKKIQVTVTFDGAEDLLVEAKLKKKDQRDKWTTIV